MALAGWRCQALARHSTFPWPASSHIPIWRFALSRSTRPGSRVPRCFPRLSAWVWPTTACPPRRTPVPNFLNGIRTLYIRLNDDLSIGPHDLDDGSPCHGFPRLQTHYSLSLKTSADLQKVGTVPADNDDAKFSCSAVLSSPGLLGLGFRRQPDDVARALTAPLQT